MIPADERIDRAAHGAQPGFVSVEGSVATFDACSASAGLLGRNDRVDFGRT
jgi:hypothetical protein